MSVHVVIPARMASTRLPNKPLADIAGVPMIVRVARQVSLAAVDSVVVAVDDERVQQVVEAAGFNAMLTALDHPSGSDRVMEVAERLDLSATDIVINVQGDEPLLPPEIIEQIADAMTAAPDIDIATLSEPIHTQADFADPNVVKVVVDANGRALYFSRGQIPFPRDGMQHARVRGVDVADQVISNLGAQRHIGVYGFRVAALKRFVALTESRLEDIERLEQLRWLEAGGRITVLESALPIPGGVDTPEDLARVEQYVLANP